MENEIFTAGFLSSMPVALTTLSCLRELSPRNFLFLSFCLRELLGLSRGFEARRGGLGNDLECRYAFRYAGKRVSSLNIRTRVTYSRKPITIHRLVW